MPARILPCTFPSDIIKAHRFKQTDTNCQQMPLPRLLTNGVEFMGLISGMEQWDHVVYSRECVDIKSKMFVLHSAVKVVITVSLYGGNLSLFIKPAMEYLHRSL